MTRRTWLRSAFLSLLFTTTTTITNVVVSASYIQHPAIDLEQLEQIGIAGPYGGASLFQDTRQLTQIPSTTASVITFSNNTFELIGHSSANGSIYTACTLTNSNLLYIGGDFLQFGPTNVSNVAAIDLNTGTISALANGLDGPVYSLHCDESSNSVYAGGRFLAPVAPAPQYSESLSYFGGGVAVWKDNLWHGLPWKGFNGPVNVITENGDTGTILFGGRFDTSADGQNYYAPSSQPVSLSSPAVISAQNSGTVNNDPKSIVCPDTLDDDPWLILDGVAGSWRVDFQYSITPSLIRLANTHQDGRGTKNFSIVSIPSNTVFNLSYIDPITKKRSQCSTDCALTDDPSVEYQDFQIRDTTLSSGIRIDVSSWYGAGGGLSSVEIFQSEIFVYAVNELNGKSCATSMDYTQRSLVSTKGTWTSDQISGSYVHLISSSFSASQAKSVSANFVPYLPESGRYEIYLYAPKCTNDCAQRSQIDVTTYPSSGGQTVKQYVDLAHTNGQSILVYTGDVEATTNDFQPHVIVTVASNATSPAKGNAIISLQAVQFIKQASNTTLSSMLEFKYDASEQAIANTTLGGSYGPLADNIPYASTVNALEASDGNVYIGGNFSSAAGATATYHNIVRYDLTSKKLVALQGTGLNGAVSSFLRKDSDLYVGGTFTGLTAAGDKSKLNNVARYTISSDKWNPLGGGVNGPVGAMHLTSDSQNVIVSGTHVIAYNQADAAYGNATSGNAWWSTGNNSWTLDTPYLSGQVSKSFQITNGSEQSTVYVGDIKAAQRYQARGFSFMNENVDLAPFPVYPNVYENKPYMITAGTFWKDNDNGNNSATIIGGQFEINNEVQNVAIYQNDAWSGIGASWEGSITMMAVNHGHLYIGGHMNQTWNSTQTGLVVYDLVNKTFIPVPELHTHDHSPSLVHRIEQDQTNGNMLVAGNFSSAGSLSCSGVCVLDTTNHQWNILGDGSVTGEALDFTYTGSKLIVAGNLMLSGSAVPIAEYNYENKKWSTFASSISDDGLPGNSTAVSYDGQSKKTFIAGQTENGAYLRVWDGQSFTVPDGELGSESIIRQLVVLPLKEAGEADLMGNNKAVLLATGFLNLGDLGNLSSALYDGSQWIPYLTVASENGSTDALQSMFFKSYYRNLNPDSYLPAPLVVLVSVASALGIVFFIVLFAMGVLFAKRRREAKVNPSANPASYYGKPPRRPESLLAMLNSSNTMAATAGATAAAVGGGTMYEAKKDHSMNGGYNDYHTLPAQPEMTETSTGTGGGTSGAAAFGATAAFGGIAAAAATAHSRGINDNQQQEQQRRYMSTSPTNNTTTYGNMPHGGVGGGATMTTGAVAAMATDGARQRNSYNPFRSSAVGVAVSDNTQQQQYASRTPINPESTNYLNVSAASDVTATTGSTAPTQVRWTNAPVPEAASAAIVGAVSMASIAPTGTRSGPSDTEDSPNAVRWTNVPAEGPATAVLGPISMYSTASNLVPDNESATNVRWTNAGVDAEAAMGTALVAPVIAGGNRASEMQEDQATTLRNMPTPIPTAGTSGAANTSEMEDDPSRVRWTNYTTHSAQGVAALRPVTAISMYSDVSSTYGPPPDFNNSIIAGATMDNHYDNTNNNTSNNNNDNNNNNKDSVFGPVRSSMLADFSSDPDIVRWTTAPNSDMAKATFNVESGHADTSSTIIPSSNNNNNNVARNSGGSNTSSRFGTRQYESGLDLESLGAGVEEPEDKYSGVMTNERSMSNEGSNNNDPSTSVAAAVVPVVTASTIATSNSIKAHEDESTTIDNTHENPKEASSGTTDNERMFKTSSFRWSETPSLPPINTNFNISNDNNNKDHALPPLSSSPGEPPIRWMETNTGSPIKSHTPQLTEPSSATVTITSPDGRDVQDNSSQLQAAADTDTGAGAAVAAAAGTTAAGRNNNPPNSALDGRAASKRMVQDYFSSRDPTPNRDNENTKPKYHKDFQAAMNAAFKNNSDDLPCSEDHPNLYYAKFDFNAREHGELGFDKGDPIIVVDRSDDIWWMGYKDDGENGPSQGVFPSNYVERASALANTTSS
ncbi:cortical protein marker for cell polarity-domain-containing protein [Phascolomyces articulosus]|uniref:Cortical protein marker for cell polarity-domain-containing protein n=1 Tax=Phascolomyces articulosus TaxID=60185 RepID=A0AAD5JXB3_9FUNG|nr:cortical protein marker for cell polarity-domain-containing protein [Phascolomyces articulosus]